MGLCTEISKREGFAPSRVALLGEVDAHETGGYESLVGVGWSYPGDVCTLL